VTANRSNDKVTAWVPLTLFEALQKADAPAVGDLEDSLAEVTARRLGLSRAVAFQIERYRKLAGSEREVSGEEVLGVLRLVARRSDAALIFTEAGRRAGRYLAQGSGGALKWVWRLIPSARVRDAVGWRLACNAAAARLGVRLVREGNTVIASLERSLAARATPDGSACKFYGSAVAELLRSVTSFDGALLHESCTARGDPACRWRSVTGFGD
jgi:predicted hydrocarbon binding protein